MTLEAGKSKKSPNGFILIEVLIAFLIIALGVIACLQSFGQSLKAVKKVSLLENRADALKPLLFEMEMGRRSDLPGLRLDAWGPDFKNLLNLKEPLPGEKYR